MIKSTMILILVVIALFVTGCAITTTVVNKDTGQPVRDVSLTIDKPNGESQTVVTDINGRYVYAPGQFGSHTITPSKDGYTFEPSQKTLLYSGMASLLANFKASTSGGGGNEDDLVINLFHSAANKDNRYSSKSSISGYKNHGAVFVADGKATSTNSPIYEYYNGFLKDYAYWPTPDLNGAYGYGLVSSTPVFYADLQPTSTNSVGMYRWFVNKYETEGWGDTYLHYTNSNALLSFFGYTVDQNPLFYVRWNAQVAWENVAYNTLKIGSKTMYNLDDCPQLCSGEGWPKTIDSMFGSGNGQIVWNTTSSGSSYVNYQQYKTWGGTSFFEVVVNGKTRASFNSSYDGTMRNDGNITITGNFPGDSLTITNFNVKFDCRQPQNGATMSIQWNGKTHTSDIEVDSRHGKFEYGLFEGMKPCAISCKWAANCGSCTTDKPDRADYCNCKTNNNASDCTIIYNKYPEMRDWICQHMPQLGVCN